jgi:hypothetical protein
MWYNYFTIQSNTKPNTNNLKIQYKKKRGK